MGYLILGMGWGTNDFISSNFKPKDKQVWQGSFLLIKYNKNQGASDNHLPVFLLHLDF